MNLYPHFGFTLERGLLRCVNISHATTVLSVTLLCKNLSG